MKNKGGGAMKLSSGKVLVCLVSIFLFFCFTMNAGAVDSPKVDEAMRQLMVRRNIQSEREALARRRMKITEMERYRAATQESFGQEEKLRKEFHQKLRDTELKKGEVFARKAKMGFFERRDPAVVRAMDAEIADLEKKSQEYRTDMEKHRAAAQNLEAEVKYADEQIASTRRELALIDADPEKRIKEAQEKIEAANKKIAAVYASMSPREKRACEQVFAKYDEEIPESGINVAPSPAGNATSGTIQPADVQSGSSKGYRILSFNCGTEKAPCRNHRAVCVRLRNEESASVAIFKDGKNQDINGREATRILVENGYFEYEKGVGLVATPRYLDEVPESDASVAQQPSAARNTCGSRYDTAVAKWRECEAQYGANLASIENKDPNKRTKKEFWDRIRCNSARATIQECEGRPKPDSGETKTGSWRERGRSVAMNQHDLQIYAGGLLSDDR